MNQNYILTRKGSEEMNIERIKKQTSIMYWSLKGTTIEEPGRRTILENGLRIIKEELNKKAKNRTFFIHKSETGLSPTQYFYLVQAKDEDSALKRVGLKSGDEELLVSERIPENALNSAQLAFGSLLLTM